MSDRTGIFAGDNPFDLARQWLSEAETSELNDPNAIALSTVDASGMPNARMVLLKDIEDAAFVFYTNYGSAKAQELDYAEKAAFVMHWKSLRRQIRVRGHVSKESGPQADDYFASRSLKSRIGAWASKQSQPLGSRAELLAESAKLSLKLGTNPKRPNSGAVIASHRLKLNSGRMARFDCMIASVGHGKIQTLLGASRG